MAGPFQGFDEDFVGDDIQCLLNLALDVFRACNAKVPSQSPPVHFMRNRFASTGNIVQQQGEPPFCLGGFALFVDQKLNQGYAFHDSPLFGT